MNTNTTNLVGEMHRHARRMMEVQGWVEYRRKHQFKKDVHGVPFISDSEYGRIYWSAAKSFLWLEVGGNEAKFREVLDASEEIAYGEADSADSQRLEMDYR